MAKPVSESLFSKSITSNLFSHSYLFYGINTIDLNTFCFTIINDYLNYHHDFSLSQDDTVPSHPDIVVLQDEPSIKIDHIKEIKDKIKYGPYALNYFFVVIQNMDLCTPQASNAFLKTLEEPTDNVIFFLITTNLHAILPTIRSRSATIYVPTRDHLHSEHDICSFESFKSFDLSTRLSMCADLASDKQALLYHLHNWLSELTQCPSPFNQDDSNLILELLETLQYNVNVRLQLENFSIQL
ncbi:hypothetical protein CL658_03385 [bacterium]|nr:hypothetical protein [bacterium]